MHIQKQILVWINLLCGTAVPASYIIGFLTNPRNSADLWGGVPENLIPLYTTSMLLAAGGYFGFTYYILFKLDAAQTRVAGRFGYGIFNWLYLAILVPSAIWMPLTFSMLAQPSQLKWTLIRLLLTIIGLASAGLVGAVLKHKPRSPGMAYWLALAGSIAFLFQTGVLDALVWTSLFPAP